MSAFTSPGKGIFIRPLQRVAEAHQPALPNRQCRTAPGIFSIRSAIFRQKIVDRIQRLLGHIPAADKVRGRLTARLSADAERLLPGIEQWALERAYLRIRRDQGLAYKMDELEAANHRIEQMAKQVIVCRQVAHSLETQLKRLRGLRVTAADANLQTEMLKRVREQSRKLSEITDRVGQISVFGAPYDVLTLGSMAQAIETAVDRHPWYDGLAQAQAMLRDFRSRLFDLFLALCSDEARNRGKLMQIRRPIAIAMLSQLPKSVRKDAERRLIASTTSESGEDLGQWPI